MPISGSDWRSARFAEHANMAPGNAQPCAAAGPIAGKMAKIAAVAIVPRQSEVRRKALPVREFEDRENDNCNRRLPAVRFVGAVERVQQHGMGVQILLPRRPAEAERSVGASEKRVAKREAGGEAEISEPYGGQTERKVERKVESDLPDHAHAAYAKAQAIERRREKDRQQQIAVTHVPSQSDEAVEGNRGGDERQHQDHRRGFGPPRQGPEVAAEPRSRADPQRRPARGV